MRGKALGDEEMQDIYVVDHTLLSEDFLFSGEMVNYSGTEHLHGNSIKLLLQ